MKGRIRLEVYPGGSVHMADVVWQRGETVGVRMVVTLDQTAEQQIEALRRLEAEMRSIMNRSALNRGY